MSLKKITAEIVSTFFLVFIGTGSVILDHALNGKITLAGISLITGATVSFMILVFGKWSGAHMNPAVTLALVTKGELKTSTIIPYFLAQGTGAFAGSFLLQFLFNHPSSLGETLPAVNIFIAFFIEIILSFLLMMVILYVSKKEHPYAAWLIGAAVALGIFLGGNYSGGSMNPIRSLSPAILNQNTTGLWIFLTGPFIGMLIAIFIFKLNKK